MVLFSPEAQIPNGKYVASLNQELTSNPGHDEKNRELSTESLQEEVDSFPTHVAMFDIFSQDKLSISFFLAILDLSNGLLDFDFIFCFWSNLLARVNNFRYVGYLFCNAIEANRNDLGSNRACQRDIVCLIYYQHLEEPLQG